MPQIFGVKTAKTGETYVCVFAGFLFVRDNYLIHGDAHGENIFINPSGGLEAVIDFGDAVYADIHMDMLWYVHGYPDNWQTVISSYELCSSHILSRKKIVCMASIRFSKKLFEMYLANDDRSHVVKKFADYGNLLNI